MNETETETNANDAVLADVDFGERTRAAMPALDYLAEQGLSMVSVPLYPRESATGMSVAKAYTVLVTEDGRRLCVPTSELPLRITGIPTFADGDSRWPEPLLRLFLESNYMPPAPAELFGGLVAVFDRYLDVAPVESKVLAAWTLSSYWFPVWPALGILHVQGAFSSGKSRVLTLLQHLTFAPVNLASATAASIFKVCGRATCLIDEAELLGGPAMRELRLILQASYRQQGGSVIRCTGRRVARWPVFGPKALASVAELPADGVLASRCIVLKLHRSTDAVKTSLKLDESSEAFGSMRAAIFATALTRWRDLLATPVDSGTLASRKLECYFPLLQVAQFCDTSGVTTAELVAYALRADGPAIQTVAMSVEERKIAQALAGLPSSGTGTWMTSTQIRDAVVLKFPELAAMTTSKLGLTLAKHRLWSQRRHTVAGKLVLLDHQRLATLAAQLHTRP